MTKSSINIKADAVIMLTVGFMFLLGVLSYTHNIRWGLIAFVSILIMGMASGAVKLDPIMTALLLISLFIVILWDYLINIPSFQQIITSIENLFTEFIPSIGTGDLTILNDKSLQEKATVELYDNYAKEGEYYIIGSTLTNQILQAFDPDYSKQLIGAKSYHINVYPKPLAYYYINTPLSYEKMGTVLINKGQYLQEIDLPDGKIGVLLPAKLKEGYIDENKYHVSKSWESSEEGLIDIADYIRYAPIVGEPIANLLT